MPVIILRFKYQQKTLDFGPWKINQRTDSVGVHTHYVLYVRNLAYIRQ